MLDPWIRGDCWRYRGTGGRGWREASPRLPCPPHLSSCCKEETVYRWQERKRSAQEGTRGGRVKEGELAVLLKHGTTSVGLFFRARCYIYLCFCLLWTETQTPVPKTARHLKQAPVFASPPQSLRHRKVSLPTLHVTCLLRA